MKRTLTSWCLSVALLTLSILVVVACTQTPTTTAPSTGTFDAGERRAGEVEAKLGTAATQVAEGAGGIAVLAQRGREATPEEVRPKLDPFWQGILERALGLRATADGLEVLRSDMRAMKDEWAKARQQLLDEVGKVQKALAEEKLARADDAKTYEKKLAAQKDEFQRDMRWIRWIILGISFAGTALLLWAKQFKMALALVGGAFVLVVLTLVLGWVDEYKWYIIGGAAALPVLYFVLETFVRKLKGGLSWGAAMSQSLTTSPAQDLEDLGKQ